MLSTKPERTGWRDERISRRHREWGCCGAVDIDFLLVEFSASYPYAIIEYKHEKAALSQQLLNGNFYQAEKTLHKNTYQALSTLGSLAKIPVIVCSYSDNLSQYMTYPVNEYAKWSYGKGLQKFNEIEYVKFLYKIRGLKMPFELEKQLKNRKYEK